MQDSVEAADERHVANGARFLDSKVPDWFKSIDLNLLNMSNPCHCVVGQLFPSYANGLSALGVNTTINEDEVLGFDRAYSYGSDSLYSCDLVALTPIWKREICARLAATS